MDIKSNFKLLSVFFNIIKVSIKLKKTFNFNFYT